MLSTRDIIRFSVFLIFTCLLSLSIIGFTPSLGKALTIESSVVKFNKKMPEQNSFDIKGNTEGLSLEGVETVTLKFGVFSQTIPIGSLQQKSRRYIYKAGRKASGITKLVINVRNGKFSVYGKNLNLAELANPMEFQLAADTYSACKMLKFTENRTTWKFNKKYNEQSPCASPPVISKVNSSVFSDVDNQYATGRIVRIDVEASGQKDIVSGTIQITSATTGYDSGVQDLTFGSIFFHWDTTSLKPASDYVVEVTLTDAEGQETTDNSLVVTLTPDPPAINKLVNQIDVNFPAIGIPVSVARTYLLDSGFNGPLGFGWTHSYLMHVVETGDGLVKIFNADGSGAFYSPKGDGTYDSPQGDFRVLKKNPDGNFQLREKFGTLFHFNSEGKLTKIEDRNGNTITPNYDVNGLLETITDASMQVTTFSYDANNRVSSITDPAGRTVVYRYDNAGDLTSVTDIGGFVTYYAYDADHNLTTVTDPVGRQTFFTTDADDRLESVSNTGNNNRQTFEYGVPTANQMIITNALGNQTILTYNNNASITEVTDPSGNITRMTYDDNLNLTRRTDAKGNQTNFTYDINGNLLTATDTQGNTVTLAYEPLFNQVTSLINANGNTTSLGYDANGNLITRNYPNSNTEIFSYDDHGKLSSLTDANGNTTTFDYDTYGHVTTMTYPDGTTEAFSYDTSGNMVNKTDRMGQIITYVYDLSGRPVTKFYPDNTSVNFDYDAAGKLLSTTDEHGTIDFEYNSSGRLTQVTYPGGEVVSYGYDTAGNRTRLTYPDGMELNYNYDPLNRLTQISNSGQMVAGYTYNALGRVIRRELQNGTYSTYNYDPSNRLLELINSKSTSEVISSFAYTYDNVGNRLTMTTLDGITQYAYDDIYQLTNVIYPDGSTTSYNLDPAGNRISEVVDGNAIDYTTNTLNQYTEIDGDAYTYDANGNMTSKTTPSGTTIYTYDFDNRLVQVDTLTETITYTYDPFGRRTSKTTSSGMTDYIHDGFRVIMEKDESDSVEATYIHGIRIDEVLMMNRGGVDYFYSQDGLGSVTDLTDLSENIIESYTYDAYGTPSNVSSMGNPYLYTGREYEPKTDLYYYRFRYYDPVIGRFNNIDPFGLQSGFNLYTYVSNNPIVLIDPFGLQAMMYGPLPPIQIPPIIQIPIVPPICPAAPPPYIEQPYDDSSDDDPCDVCKILPDVMKGPGSFCCEMCDDCWRPDDDSSDWSSNINTGDPTFIQNNSQMNPKDIILGDNQIAMILVPFNNSLIRANVPIFGQAYGKDFKEYRVEYGEGKNPTEWFHIYKSTIPQTKKITPDDLDDSLDLTIYGNLATWDTGLKNYVYLPSHPKDHPINLKGTYTIRLVVTGNDGSTVEDRVTVNVANVIPNAWGGKAVSKDGKVVLTVPEQAIMDSFRLILIETAKNERVASPSKRQVIGNIYKIREPGEQFTKEALLHMAYQKEDMGDSLLNQLGIYGYNLKTKAWEYLDSTRDEENHFVFAKIRKLHAYYTLMASKMTGEGSAVEPVLEERSNIQQAVTIQGYGYTLVKNTFEDGLGEWSNRDNEVGATVTIDNTATFDGTHAAKITNTHVGGNFAVNVITTPFDVREYPLVQFDYRIPREVKTNFLVKVSGCWYDIGFTDDPKTFKDKRVNIAHIGDINDVVTDDQWHTAQFNLYNMLKSQTGHTLVEEIIMSDWDVGGYMKLKFGQNPPGSTYYIDNFTICRETLAGLGMDDKTIVVDHFNQKKKNNNLGGITDFFSDSMETQMESRFSEEDAIGKGHSLKLSFDVSRIGSYAGYVTALQNIDLRGFQVLKFYVKGIQKNQDVMVGIKDTSGSETKVNLSCYLPDNTATSWQQVEIPLVAFSSVKDWGKLENLSFSFENELSDQGTVFLDNIEFQKEIKSFRVDDFERDDRMNSLGRNHGAFASGAAAINGQYAKGSPNGIYRLSYGGNIGKINAYASDLKSYAGWSTSLGGIDCSKCDTLSFRVRGAEGGENFSTYLDDGNFRWALDIAKYLQLTTSWQEVRIPLREFADYGVDLTHLTEFQVVFEGEKMSGTIYLDDIQFGSSPEHTSKN